MTKKLFTNLRTSALAIGLAAALITQASAQDLPRVPPAQSQDAANAQIRPKPSGSTSTPQKAAKKVGKKVGKKKWIIIGVVAGVTVTALLIFNIPLKNEGKGIF